MAVPGRYILLAFLFALLPGAAAWADCNGCRRQPPGCHQNCAPPPPPACQNCRPPTVVVPPPYVPPPNVVVVNAGAQAQASAMSIAIANVRGGDITIRGGGGYASAGATAAITGAALAVADAEVMTESETRERMALVQAICVDATGNPHPASQTFAGRDVATDHKGEIFRCMAGTRMRVTVGERTFECAANEALWHENGQVTCKTQIARRPCNERSLLRRFGPGEKMVRVRETTQIGRAHV